MARMGDCAGESGFGGIGVCRIAEESCPSSWSVENVTVWAGYSLG